MNLINDLSNESKLEFKNLSEYANDNELWVYMFNECLQANIKIQNSKFSLKKFRKQLRNVMKLVKVFNTMIVGVPIRNVACTEEIMTESQQDISVCTNCPILTEQIDDLHIAIQIKDIQLSELQNNVKRVCVNSKVESNKSSEMNYESKANQKYFVPDMRSIEIDLEDQDHETLLKRKLVDKASELNLKIFDQLMKIAKEIPSYDENKNVLDNAEIFELYSGKFQLNEEHKNIIFRLWLPCNYSQQFKPLIVMDDGRTMHSNEYSRLKQLISFYTGEKDPSTEILDCLQVSSDDDPFIFLRKFEKAYRIVLGIAQDQTPASMITAFIKKFTFLDPASVVLASQKQCLDDVLEIIDTVRRQMNLTKQRNNGVDIQNGDQRRVATCMATPNHDGIHVTGRAKVSEQTGNAICFFCKEVGHIRRECIKYKLDSQRKMLELENEKAFEQSVHPCPNNRLVEMPYASGVKQISTLTVNDNSINMTNSDVTDRDGLLPLPKSGLNQVLTPMYNNVRSICTAIVDKSSDYNWPHTGTNLELEQLVRSHKNLWSQSKNETGLLKDIEVDIEGRDPKPQLQYKLPRESIGPVSLVIQEFLQQGILKKTRSVVNNCIWPIKNADNSYSLSVDVRSLNKCITNEKSVVPDLNVMMSHLDAKAKVFSVLEVSNSHFSVPVAKSCQYKLAFSFNKETYAFTRIIPGLDISDGIVHESLGKILSKFSKPECVFQHVDKFLLSTQSIEEHITLLSELFTLFLTAGLKLNTQTVQLMKNQVKFFHMEINHGQRKLSQEKVKTIFATSFPTTHKALHQFLSKINHCREFVQKCNDKVKPLVDLLRQKDVFDQWSQTQINAFEVLKREIKNAPLLHIVDFCCSIPFVLQTDVSENSISVTLSQLKEGDQKIIGFFSRGLTNMERTFDAHIKQLLSVYFAIKVTENIVRSSKIILQTSDPSLKCIIEKMNSEKCQIFSQLPKQVFRTLSSKSIQVDLITEHSQQSAQTDVSTNADGVFGTSAERGCEPVLVDAIKIGRSAGLSMWYPKNGYAIQQKFKRKC